MASSIAKRVQMATTAAWDTFRRVYADPEGEQSRVGWQSRASEYRALWAWYNNSIFDDLAQWSAYKSRYRLPRHIRSIYNPTRRLVDFYAATVYPGVLSEDGSDLPDGVQNAIPLADDTPPALRQAIAQLWQWSNWQAGKSIYVRYGAALGNSFVEVIDDLERGKVYFRNWWPGYVADLDLDHRGNVRAYALEYRVDDGGGSYTFRKQVNKDSIATFKNGNPFDYDPESGLGAEYANPYGFAPAVWVPHVDLGGDHGAYALNGTQNKIDELNSTASLIHDQIRKLVQAPLIVWAEEDLKPLFSRGKRGKTEELPDPNADREAIMWFKGPKDGSVSHLSADLNFAGAWPFMEQLLTEIEQDHPELNYFQQMREMSTVTGPAAARLIGDVAARVYEAASNYDRGSIALFQMGVAIAGWRVRTGAWTKNSKITLQQRKFMPFDLTSYERGQLDFALMPRPLIQKTSGERLKEEETPLWEAASKAIAAGLPLEIFLKRNGWTDEDLEELQAFKDAEAKKRAEELEAQVALAQAQSGPSDAAEEDEDGGASGPTGQATTNTPGQAPQSGGAGAPRQS